MRLMPDRNAPCLEDEMQDKVAEYFANRIFLSSEPYHKRRIIPKVYREVYIAKIGRISDIIIFITDRKIVNIECKLIDYNGVINQAIDHLKWADYSYVCFYADTYLPAYVIDKMLSNGIGLLLWQPGMFAEVLQSGFNKLKDKSLRTEVLSILRKKDHIITGLIESDSQKTIFE
jgi:hypothetical protein